MKNDNLVVYLFTKYDDQKSLIDFANNYVEKSAGNSHKLLICFKLIEEKKILFLESLLPKIEYIKFIDPCEFNDFDFGSYKRIAKLYQNYNILFLNSHSYPNTNLWLSKLLHHFKDKYIIATSASYVSLYSSIKLKKFYKIFSYLIKRLSYKSKYYSYPNPHIRTTGFLITGSDFYEFIKNKKISTKHDAWEIESGKKGLTNYFKKKNYNILLINSDGICFNEKNWMYSETYNYLNQTKSIISDKHSRKYYNLDSDQKQRYQFHTWGL